MDMNDDVEYMLPEVRRCKGYENLGDVEFPLRMGELC
ncbi:hypothetical protein Thermo_00755 [Thermoplasmatales archaeon]|nr:hypothetical protein Thermo_00755 [Thermoplasmatales archaeon]